MTTTARPTWLRMSAAADLVGVHRTTLSKWVTEGRIERRFLLQTGTQVRIARAWCEGTHLLPAPVHQAAPVAPITFPAVSYTAQALG